MRTRPAGSLFAFEKHQQLIPRHAPAFIRDVLDTFRQRKLTATQATDQLGISPRRLYALATAYLRARAKNQGSLWLPGRSGGNPAAPWPQPVLDLLDKRLNCSPPCPYRFVASEALRLHHFKLDRAQVRRWALQNHLAHAVPPKKVRAAVRRWQRQRIGELWQLDASPHRWFPASNLAFPLLNRLDDCRRLFTGAKLYERELRLAYFDFLPAAFLAHGRPLQRYVDYHRLFFTHDPDALTPLGGALKFDDIRLRYAPTPKAKSNANTRSGRAGCRPVSPAKKLPESRWPIRTLMPCGGIPTPRKSIVNWDRLRNAPGIRPARKSAPHCVRHRAAPGGIMWAAGAPPLTSAPMAACPLARSGCEWKDRRAARWCFASTRTATTPCWPPRPIPNKNPCSSSPTAPYEHSCSANYKKFLF
jgi:hypothetical protein